MDSFSASPLGTAGGAFDASPFIWRASEGHIDSPVISISEVSLSIIELVTFGVSDSYGKESSEGRLRLRRKRRNLLFDAFLSEFTGTTPPRSSIVTSSSLILLLFCTD